MKVKVTTSIHSRGKESVELYLHSPIRLSGMVLRHRGNFITLTYTSTNPRFLPVHFPRMEMGQRQTFKPLIDYFKASSRKIIRES
jgi:hypothetical protein